MLIRLQAFDLHVAYKPGKDLHIHTVSRAYLQEQTELLEEELEVNQLSAHTQSPISEYWNLPVQKCNSRGQWTAISDESISAGMASAG